MLPCARYAALGLLLDRAVPTMLSHVEGCPALAPVALACLLVASKLHEDAPPLISELLAAEVTLGAMRVSVAEVNAAELWLCTDVHIGIGTRLVTDVIDRLLSASDLLFFVDRDTCKLIVDTLALSTECEPSGWLSGGGRSLAVAIISAAAALTVPAEQRLQAAPALAWLATSSEEGGAPALLQLTEHVLRLVLGCDGEAEADEAG
jgi:hypothetical protein